MVPLALLLPLLVLGGPAGASVARPKAAEESLNLDNGLSRGDWGEVEFCPDGSYVMSFEIKYSGVGSFDDTSVNAIRLYCETPAGSLSGLITSSEGSYGQWQGMRTCPKGEYLNGVRANIVPDMGPLSDDLGMDNLQMNCSGGKILDGLHGTPIKAGQNPLVARDITHIDSREVEAVYLKIQQSAMVRDLGDWGAWRTCSSGNKVCGLQVRLEDNHVFDDDAGVTDVVMYCCK